MCRCAAQRKYRHPIHEHTWIYRFYTRITLYVCMKWIFSLSLIFKTQFRHCYMRLFEYIYMYILLIAREARRKIWRIIPMHPENTLHFKVKTNIVFAVRKKLPTTLSLRFSTQKLLHICANMHIRFCHSSKLVSSN